MNTTAITRKSNRGFSLVELIIVIAIMAILTALLAPQFLKYVERAREARDRANIMAVYQAFQIAVTDPLVTVSGETGGTVYAQHPSGGAPITYYADGRLQSIGTTLENAFAEIYGEQGRYKPGTTTDAGSVYYVPPLVSKKYSGNIIFRFSYSESYPTRVAKGYIRVYCPPLD